MKYPQLVSMPSAISDWLEEQLEARGIDAVVYTRYVLSLLYRDPVDIICPDQDQEVRPGGGGRKRFCRASYHAHHHWAHADAERLQRSAAVECLKSASDQKCGIESLVDELCAKLKALQQRSLAVPEAVEVRSKPVRIPRKHAERDSARRYYAAFPALTAAAATTSPQLLQIVPKWLGSPKRRKAHELETKPPPPPAKYHRKQKPSKAPAGSGNKMASVNKMAAGVAPRDAPQHVVLVDVDVDDDDEMYDLPLLDDIRELLESCSPPTDAPSPVCTATGAAAAATTSSKFLQCGTNIISSIWSTTDETSADAHAPLGDSLDVHFGSIAIDHAHALWSNWSDDCDRDHQVAQSLLKLNHTREGSGFTEVQPRRVRSALPPPPTPTPPPAPEQNAMEDEADAKDDDLLHSARSHFKPINEGGQLAAEEAAAAAKQPRYVDGTTFAIHASLDVVAFERSASGTMYLQEAVDGAARSTNTGGGGGGGGGKRYLEYKREHAFNVKFNVNPNDKGCQTDAHVGGGVDAISPPTARPAPAESPAAHAPPQPPAPAAFSDQRPDSSMAELFNARTSKCANCASAIGTPVAAASASAAASAENIWNGEICMGCLQLSTTSLVTPRRLREDIQEDGERLLSDLSTLQQSYMDDHLIGGGGRGGSSEAEECCDITALICATPGGGSGGGGGGAVRKLRVPIHSASFSFATRLQQDCLLKMATIPTLRSVTL